MYWKKYWHEGHRCWIHHCWRDDNKFYAELATKNEHLTLEQANELVDLIKQTEAGESS